MSLLLSDAEIDQLERTLAVVSSPLAYESVGSWRRASRAAASSLLGAEDSVSWLPLAGEPLMQLPGAGDEVFARSQAYFAGDDPGIAKWRREPYDVAAQLQAYPIDEPRTEAWYHEVVSPLGLQHALFMAAPAMGGYPATLMFFLPPRPTARAAERTARGLTLLRLVSPAYRAGIRHCLQFAGVSRALGSVVDALADGVALCDAAGKLSHRNPALARLVAADAEGAQLVAEIAHCARTLGSLVERRRFKSREPDHLGDAVLREVRTSHARYRLHASYVGRELVGPWAAVAVLVALLAPEELTADELQARYDLTAREVEVARLLALGRSNTEMARALGLRATTTRHYTEHVLTKLGLTSRAGVAAALRRGTESEGIDSR